ncbi:hypothetical protein GQ600_11347 [Phytophthora cactorum]|nr:hypothetical protein GQ600_11347 [Phytophthora cactorum]
MNNLVHRSLLFSYQPETSEIDKWSCKFDEVVVREKHWLDSFAYATKIASGLNRGSNDGFLLLVAYCVVEGTFQIMRQTTYLHFLENLTLSKTTTQPSDAAKGKWNKKKRIVQRMDDARESRKQKVETTR